VASFLANPVHIFQSCVLSRCFGWLLAETRPVSA